MLCRTSVVQVIITFVDLVLACLSSWPSSEFSNCLANFPSLKVKSTLTDSSIKKGREGGRVGKDSKICNIKPHNNFHIEKNYQTLFATHCLGSS